MKEVKILGTGCPKCEQLKRNTEQAAAECGMECSIEKITDMLEISKYGVIMTPGLVVDNEVKSVGKVISSKEIQLLLK